VGQQIQFDRNIGDALTMGNTNINVSSNRIDFGLPKCWSHLGIYRKVRQII